MLLRILSLSLLGSSLFLVACTQLNLSGDRQMTEAPIAEWHCGQQAINTEFVGERLHLTLGEQQIVLEQVISASGAKYQIGDDEDSSLWFKGRQATLELAGNQYPVCVPAAAVIEPFRGSGNEPFWSVNLNEGLLTLSRLGEESIENLPYTQGESDGQISAGKGEQTINLQVTDQLCRDTMSGMVFPQRVELEFNGQVLQGCGGQSARLLQGVEWVVEDINDGGIIDNSRVTLNFETDGRINGRASCNQFMGQYQLTGESLSIRQPATTMMACAPALMEQEQRVLNNLETLQAFDFDETGALLLRSRDGMLKARGEAR